MLSGKEKAQVLISILGPSSKEVLKKLSKESAVILTGAIENTPSYDNLALNQVLDEIITESKNPLHVETQHIASATPTPEPTNEPEPQPANEPTPQPANEPEAQPNEEENQPNMEEIAQKLSQQRPQIIAFMLSRMDEGMSKEIIHHLPDHIISQVRNKDVETIPMSDKIYDLIHAEIFNQ